MGTYLSTPVLDKHTEKGSDIGKSNAPVRWAVVDMQGWRKSMEDAHVARTDVPLPSCYKKEGDDGGGGGGSDGDNGENKMKADASHAKVFAVFDGHGGAEVARFCQIHLVPVLTSQSHWKDCSKDSDVECENMSMAACIGHALIESFHALDRLIDDPTLRPEIDKWRSERPPPYIAGQGDDEDARMEEAETEEKRTVAEEEPMEVEDVQQRRHTAMDPAEIADSAEKLHMIDDGDDESDDSGSEDGSGGATAEKMDQDSNKMEEGGQATTGGEDDGNTPNGTNNANHLSSVLDDNDDDDEVFEDSLSEPSDVVHDDSDDEKEETSNENENDDGEPEKTSTAIVKKEGAGAGTMVLSANDAVALFQKLLHMNGTDEDDKDDDEEEDEEEDDVANGEKMNGDASGESDGSGGGGQAEVVIPTKEQLLNPPTGIVAPSASVPTRIQNGRKICNLPDHPVHAGCTSVVAVIVGRTLVVANAGDSRAVICRAGGLTEPLSFDHKPLQNREMNRITNAGGFVNQFGRVNGNLNLSRSIGDLKYKQVPGISPAEQMITAEPDILSTTLRPGDEFIVLGCDGIWDCLSNEECVKYVRDRIDSKHPHEIGIEMLDEIVSADPRASQGIGGDNMTIMIVDLLPESRPYHS